MEFHTEEVGVQPFVFIRTQTKITEIGDKIGACLGQLAPFVGDNAAGMPIARYTEWDAEGGTMEIGMPVKAAMESQGDIQAGDLPAGRAAVVTHVGAYDGLAATWDALKVWMANEKLEGRDSPWEQYIDDPGAVPADEVRTRIYWPV